MIVIIKLFSQFPTLHGIVYTMRRITESDYKDILEIYSDNETVKYDSINIIESVDDIKKHIRFINQGYEERIFISWGIADNKTDKIIGIISLQHFDYFNGKAEVGYILNKKYWGKGIMINSLSLLINYAFDELNFHRLELIIHPANLNSINLGERLGFKIEGVKRECELNLKNNNYEDRIIMGLINKKSLAKIS